MRTKALLCAAAVAAGAVTAMAQSSNVYSLNVVGYVNVTIPHGYSLLNNPLDGGNNTVSNLFSVAVGGGSGPALGSVVFTWNGAGLTPDANDLFSGDWQTPGTVLAPGTGFFFQNPNGPFTNTFVGTVPQGALSTSLAKGYSLHGSLIPITGFLTTDLGATNAAPGDVVFLWNGTGLTPCANDLFGGGWQTPLPNGFVSDAVKGPQITIGTAFFYQNNSGSVIPWNLNFTVQ